MTLIGETANRKHKWKHAPANQPVGCALAHHNNRNMWASRYSVVRQGTPYGLYCYVFVRQDIRAEYEETFHNPDNSRYERRIE